MIPSFLAVDSSPRGGDKPWQWPLRLLQEDWAIGWLFTALLNKDIAEQRPSQQSSILQMATDNVCHEPVQLSTVRKWTNFQNIHLVLFPRYAPFYARPSVHSKQSQHCHRGRARGSDRLAEWLIRIAKDVRVR